MDDSRPEVAFYDAVLYDARDTALHLRGQPYEQHGHHLAPRQARERPDRPHVRLYRAGLRRPLHAHGRRLGLGGRRRGYGVPHPRPRNDEARLRPRMGRRGQLPHGAHRRDDSSVDGAHHIRNGRRGLHRTPLRRGLRAGHHHVHIHAHRDLVVGAPPRLQAGPRQAISAQRHTQSLLGKYLGSALPVHTDSAHTLRHHDAFGVRRVRYLLCLHDRSFRL